MESFDQYAKEYDFAEIVPVSATTGENLDVLRSPRMIMLRGRIH